MHGVLWRWLFALGTIFWIALCLVDYQRKSLEQNYNIMETLIELEPPPPILLPTRRRTETPALTFWKCLSIVLSVSALVVIKRLAQNRKKAIIIASNSEYDVIRPTYEHLPPRNAFLTKVDNLKIIPKPRPVPDFQYQSVFRQCNTSPSAMGVKLVQKKLEDLETNIQNLKERITNNSTTNGIISGSNAFQNFLISNMPNKYQQTEDIIIHSSSSSETFFSLETVDKPTKKQINATTEIKKINEIKMENKDTEVTFSDFDLFKMYDDVSVSENTEDILEEVNISEATDLNINVESEDTSVASTSISSLSETLQQPGKVEPKTTIVSSKTSLRSLMPYSNTSSSVTSYHNVGSIGNKSFYISKQHSPRTVHNLALNYLQSMQREYFDTQDSSSDISNKTKTVIDKYSATYKKSQSSSVSNTTHRNLSEDNYWLLHW